MEQVTSPHHVRMQKGKGTYEKSQAEKQHQGKERLRPEAFVKRPPVSHDPDKDS
ncbi:MAG: hypothetical protein ABIH63_03930 [archaeon]